MIPYNTQYIDNDDICAVTDALQGEYLTCGPTVEAFEKKFAEFVGARYAVAVSSGTAALHIACAIIGIHGGDEVIVSPNTWVSSANAVLYCGGVPVFADIEGDTYNISTDCIEACITPSTRAIIAVHYAGQPCRLDEIHEIARHHNLYVIEDAAHAVGAFYKSKKIGALSNLTAFSFHPVKNMTTCEGGMLTTNDQDMYEKAKLFRQYGIIKTKGGVDTSPWFSDQSSLGYNYRLSDVQCALGISQLKKVERFIARRREIAAIYDTELAPIAGIVLPRQDNWIKSGYHLYPILVDAKKRKQLYMDLRDAGIGVGVHYFPVYKNSYYQKIGYKHTCCPMSEDFYAREISLPIHCKLSNSELDFIVQTLKKVVL